VWNYFRLLSGGLRYAATTGYYLTALQAEPTRYQRVEHQRICTEPFIVDRNAGVS